VVWRGAGGAPRVMSDLCVHRGTALSLGRIQGDELACAYHGWRYAADGRCVAIPRRKTRRRFLPRPGCRRSAHKNATA
jgi:phenylpropionate dioxygenase-like ring-hydroxylating dioxygenase large terminal subunit